MLDYIAIPTPDEWQTDCYIASTKNDDPVLARIVTLLTSYKGQANGFADIVVLSDLFFTLDYWVEVSGEVPAADARLADAMLALYRCTASLLCCIFKCAMRSLPDQLESFYGSSLSIVDKQLDPGGRVAEDITRSAVLPLRLRFVDGRAFQFAWWRDNPLQEWVLASSKPIPGVSQSSSGEKFATFVMGAAGDIYLVNNRSSQYDCHATEDRNDRLRDIPLACSGTMSIRNGLILAIRFSSGPGSASDQNAVRLLQALEGQGVKIDRILIENSTGTLRAFAQHFLTGGGDWRMIEQLDQHQSSSHDLQAPADRLIGSHSGQLAASPSNLALVC